MNGSDQSSHPLFLGEKRTNGKNREANDGTWTNADDEMMDSKALAKGKRVNVLVVVMSDKDGWVNE